MLNDLRDRIINFITSRLFVLTVIMFALFGILINRLFELQIVNGENYQKNFTLRILKEQSIKSTRGKIFDCNGELLASDELAYSVTIEDNYDSTGKEKNRQLNETIKNVLDIINAHGKDIAKDFQIRINDDGEYEYAVEGKSLLRFLADIYGHSNITDLKLKEKSATPLEVIEYLSDAGKFGIGRYELLDNGSYKFYPVEGYDRDELLKMVSIRYAMSLNSYQKYIATTIATGLDEATVAVIMENKNELQGVDIAEDTVRKYRGDESLSPILGYTGIISQTELDEYNSQGGAYERTDMVGRAGIELVMEKELQGKKGYRKVYVDNLGKVVEVASQTKPQAGNDLYLTIDSKLQSAVYHILEQKLAGIIVSHIRNKREYEIGIRDAGSNIEISIDEVLYALFNNCVIDLNHLYEDDAGYYEKSVHQAYEAKEASVLAVLRNELVDEQTPYEQLQKEYKVYESFVVNQLASSNVGILVSDAIDEKDTVYQDWKAEKISLAEYLRHAIAMEWIDVTKLNISGEYSDTDEVYGALVEKIMLILTNNTAFQRKVFKYMIEDDDISPLQICMLLFEQGAISDDVEAKAELISGAITPYSFIIQKIRKLEITPAQLALDPCTASCVVVDVNTGEVRACVSYPSYDNNRLAGTIDADYYNKLRNDLSNPLYSYATQQKTAPGSTYKIVSAMAGIKEHVINIGENIECIGQYDKVDNPKCWKFPSSHGMLDVSGAIRNSCNFFFYEDGYRLGIDDNYKYSSALGLKKLAKYADEFGLSETSGIELSEASPTLSDEDSVRSAIGQGTNSFTTVQLARYVTTVANSGTCYNISLIDKVTGADGSIVVDYTPQVRNIIDADKDIWRAIHIGMRGVVEDAAAFKDSGVDAAGKTGTAQQVKNRPNHALFVGYAPYSNPEISIASRIAYGYTSANAAEVARDVFWYYFKLRDESEIITGTAEIPTSGTISD